MPKKLINYGKTVIDGKLRYASPSSIQRADASSSKGGGCLKQWFLNAVMGWPRGESGAGAELGNQCHNEIDSYLTTGQNVLGRITGAARRFMPLPQCIGVHVELPLGGQKEDLSESMLEIEGTPIVMYLDVVDRRGQYLDESGDAFFADPSGTLEYLDWKFGAAKLGSIKPQCYAKRGPELAHDTQMTLGGLAIATKWNTEHVRLSHVYTNTQGAPESSKASIRVTIDELEARTDYTAGIIRIMKDAAREIDAEKIPGNPFACNSFKGCPYKENCSTWKQGAGLTAFYGTTELETVKTHLGDQSMSLLAGINLPGMNPPVTASPAGVAAQLQVSSHDVMAQMAAVAQQAPVVPAFVPAQPTPEFAQALGVINSKGYGFVALIGRAAQMFGVLNQHPNVTSDYKVQGFGTLGNTGREVEDPAIIIGMAQEIAAVPQNPKGIEKRQPTAAPSVLGILSPSAPASNPVLAADPVPGFTPPSAVTPGVQVPGLIASVQPAAAAAILATNAPAAAPALPQAPADAPKAKRKYTRRAGVSNATETVTGESETGDASWLFVNCRSNINLIDLQPLIDGWCDGLVKMHKCNPPDIRAQANGHAFSFGNWKGYITAVARFKASELPPGGFYLNTRNSETNQCVLEGLRAAKRITQNPDGTITEGDIIFELITQSE